MIKTSNTELEEFWKSPLNLVNRNQWYNSWLCVNKISFRQNNEQYNYDLSDYFVWLIDRLALQTKLQSVLLSVLWQNSIRKLENSDQHSRSKNETKTSKITE